MDDEGVGPALPEGYRARAAREGDVEAIQRLVEACERDLYGAGRTDAGAVAADLARPGLVPELDTLVVHDAEGRLAARAWVNRRSEVDVHPEHRGRGLGTALLDWAGARAVESGAGQIVQTVPDTDARAVALLRSRGYEPMVSEWLLEFGLGEEPAVPAAPEGVTVRPFRAGDEREAHQLIEDAFADWQSRRRSYEEWARSTVERPAFAPELSALAVVGGRIVGAAVSLDLAEADEGFIEQVAVHRDHRGRGIATLLLFHVFRAFHRRGRSACTLGTHSQTGALDLYLRAGMTVRHSATVFRKGLDHPESVPL